MIKVHYKQFKKKDNLLLLESIIPFNNYKEALDFILDYHNEVNDYTATYIVFGNVEAI